MSSKVFGVAEYQAQPVFQAGIRSEGAGGTTSFVGGPSAVASGGGNGVAVGSTAEATQPNTTVVGAATEGFGNRSTCLGYFSRAHGLESIAIGDQANVSAPSSSGIAIGNASSVTSSYAVAVGESTVASHLNSIAMGRNAVSTGTFQFTVGTIGGFYDMSVRCGKGIGVWGQVPPGSQPAKISDPSGGATIDSEARTAIQSIIDVLEGAGLSADV